MCLLFCWGADWVQPSRRPTLNASSFGEHGFSGSMWNLLCRKRTTQRTSPAILVSFEWKTAELLLSIDERSRLPASFSVELWCTAVLNGVRCGGVPDVGPARHKSSSKLANPVFNWCRLNFCTEKSTFAPYLGQVMELFARIEAGLAPYSMTWVYRSIRDERSSRPAAFSVELCICWCA